jgi:predicted ATPase
MGVKSYLIEGVSGTGKTAVCKELQRRGYHTHAQGILLFRNNACPWLHGSRAYCTNRVNDRLLDPRATTRRPRIPWWRSASQARRLRLCASPLPPQAWWCK